MSDDFKMLYTHIALLVRVGFDNRDAIIENTVDLFHDDVLILGDDVTACADSLRPHVAKITDDLIAGQYAVQKFWNFETDCDKLDDAFAELDRNGIVARQNFTCCQTCGHAEIKDEILNAQEYRRIRGYVFFHQQDSEHAAESDTLHLAYGAVDRDEDESVVIGHEIVTTLRKHKLIVEWNGTIQKRIKIKELHWQRRRLPEHLLKAT
jgi:hypothetical protein